MSPPPHAGNTPEALPPLDDVDEPVRVQLQIEDWLTVLVMGALALVGSSATVARDRHIRIEYFSDSGSMAPHKTPDTVSLWLATMATQSSLGT